MTGVILCGGQSLRMGRDKGLIVSGNRNVWAEIMIEKLSQISLRSVLSINSSQKENYLQYFNAKDLVVDSTEIDVQGPVLGLMSTHLKYPDEDLFVLACDMIKMDGVVLKKLLSDYANSKPAAIAFKGDRVEPLCAIYSSAGLSKIYSSHLNKLSKNSMKDILDELGAVYISIPEEWKSFFKNLNSDKDLN